MGKKSKLTIQSISLSNEIVLKPSFLSMNALTNYQIIILEKKKSVLRFGIIIRLWVEVVRVKSLHVKSRVSWDEFRIK